MRCSVLFLCLLCLLCAPVMAQDKTNAAAAGEEVKIESNYDKAKDETTIEFTQLRITSSDEQQVLLSVSAVYPGHKLKKPEDVKDIIFILSVISTRAYRYPDIMAMQVTADGKKLPELLMLNLDKRRMDEDYLETIGTRMKYEIFKRLTQAKTVELRLHTLTLKLDESQITKLRELEALLHQ